jgi:ribosomal protein S27AE
MKKKFKVEIPDSALKDVPEDEREGVKDMIKDLFANEVDPAEIGTPVEKLPEGAKFCPECGGALVAGPTFPLEDNTVVQIFDCTKCGASYMGEPLN